MNQKQISIAVFGSSGGVAKSVLALLGKSAQTPDDPLYEHLRQCRLHLVDWKQREAGYYKAICPSLSDKITLHKLDLTDLDTVRRFLAEAEVSLVIDTSWADTVEMLELCDELAIAYVNTALEIASVDASDQLHGFTLLERYHIFEERRGSFQNTKAIVCSGMNPGVVQWMAHEMLKETPDELPIACYVVETDNTFYKDKSLVKPRTVYSSWSPECFLDEAISNYPMFVQQHTPLVLYNDVYELQFKVTLGDIQFYGCLMPHEEVLTMGQHYNMEFGFIYKVNDYTIGTIRDNLQNSDDLWEWNHKVLDPGDAELTGADLVGVLLVYKDKERFMYNVMDNASVYAKYGANATYFQVACGVYGAVCSLLLDEVPNGVHYVDDLLMTAASSYGHYVSRYMTPFIKGENAASDGLLLQRMRPFRSS
ncbi:S-adenosylmethionine decarboxylase related protein [Paenibacillus sp. NEAU-GSW1]|uniref:S-adenosylmethionine decarboxylase related protein n=1 Tax=Paenibacillus sp. NEAU-GSW1 TaxID=2682486 RepID=UPI0012E17857|nr:S-adenosylmethionine decarboxylase related protein [Paenibacillus sp. NEAU-GSW1]MUT64799.1 S-adenosylmethionine decarboxylase related protein [Paenibacillus sp. NEAU-GSW1]